MSGEKEHFVVRVYSNQGVFRLECDNWEDDLNRTLTVYIHDEPIARFKDWDLIVKDVPDPK